MGLWQDAFNGKITEVGEPAASHTLLIFLFVWEAGRYPISPHPFLNGHVGRRHAGHRGRHPIGSGAEVPVQSRQSCGSTLRRTVALYAGADGI